MKKWIYLNCLIGFLLTGAVVAQSKVGINTTTPTTTLDVNGNLRVRANLPAKGAMLVSNDANGTATWQKPVAFRAEGTSDGQGYTTTGSLVSTRFDFGAIPVYNIGLAYSANASTFTAPVKGIYHFDVKITTYKPQSSLASASGPTISLVRTRGSASVMLDQCHFYLGLTNAGDLLGPELNNRLGGDFLLEAGDDVWVSYQTQYSTLVYGDAIKHAFSGHLVHQVF